MTTSSDPSIREGGLAFFYNLARCLKEDFAPFTQKLVEFALPLAESQEAVTYENTNKEQFDLGSDSDEDGEMDVA